jgi:hypothetical protein
MYSHSYMRALLAVHPLRPFVFLVRFVHGQKDVFT